jgi:hypothetical protein
MGVYIRKTRYWLYLERPGQKGIRISTMIPVHAPSPRVVRRNRQLAEDLYAIRMGEMARDRLLAARGTLTVVAEVSQPTPPPLTEGGWCYLYFVQRSNLVKIGKTTNVARRLETFRTANHEPLTLLSAVPAHADLEAAVHRRFAEVKRTGEWFEMCDDLQAFIDALNRGVNPVALLIPAPRGLAATG